MRAAAVSVPHQPGRFRRDTGRRSKVICRHLITSRIAGSNCQEGERFHAISAEEITPSPSPSCFDAPRSFARGASGRRTTNRFIARFDEFMGDFIGDFIGRPNAPAHRLAATRKHPHDRESGASDARRRTAAPALPARRNHVSGPPSGGDARICNPQQTRHPLSILRRR